MVLCGSLPGVLSVSHSGPAPSASFPLSEVPLGVKQKTLISSSFAGLGSLISAYHSFTVTETWLPWGYTATLFTVEACVTQSAFNAAWGGPTKTTCVVTGVLGGLREEEVAGGGEQTGAVARCL